MKTILQKRSKFIAGLFHTLAIITCVSLTSCEKKEQPNEKRNALLADLKKIGFSKDESLKIIDYCFEQGIGNITTWVKNKSNLKKIFNNEASKIWSKIQHQNGNEDNVQTRIINEWKIKLQNFQEFKELVPDKQNQVIDLFIKGNVNINFPDDRLKTKLKEFVEQIDDDDKNVLLVTFTTGKAEVNGKIFDLNTFDGLKVFSNEVKGKKINKTGNFSYDLVGEKKVKICNGTEIDLSSNFTEFLEVLNILAEVDELNVKGFSLQVESDGVALNTIKCSDKYYKEDFWNYVKDHPALFGLSSNKLPIEKAGNDDDAGVKIKGKLVSNLKWNDVVEVEDTDTEGHTKEIIKEEWGKIFKLKEKVTVTFLNNGSYTIVDTDKAKTIGDAAAIELNDLGALEKLVKDLDCKELTVEDEKNLTVAFAADCKVKIGGNTNAFPVVDKNNFERFLKALDALKKCITFNPKITLKVDEDVEIGGQKVDNNFVKSASFWNSIKNHVDLFDSLGTNQLEITNESKKVKIGNFQTELYITTVCENFNDELVVFKNDWNKIFKKKLVL